MISSTRRTKLVRSEKTRACCSSMSMNVFSVSAYSALTISPRLFTVDHKCCGPVVRECQAGFLFSHCQYTLPKTLASKRAFTRVRSHRETMMCTVRKCRFCDASLPVGPFFHGPLPQAFMQRWKPDTEAPPPSEWAFQCLPTAAQSQRSGPVWP